MEIIVLGFAAAAIFELLVLGILRFFHFYTVVQEGRCRIYVIFGEVAAVVKEPGLHFMWPRLTWRALIMSFLGKVYDLDLRMDQNYLRNQHVNSEEGAPMGVGIWYEMFVHDPTAYLFRNSDPAGSLQANVSNATVRTLSNLPLSKLLEERHVLSSSVRKEVTLKSQDWGYKVGSVYIRKVQFNDANMIREIESKVVNRLRQVTASIKQDGDNQVHIITNTAQRMASIEFGRAAAVRPELVGKALSEISQDKDVATALFEVMEAQRMLENPGELILVPANSGMIKDMLSVGL